MTPYIEVISSLAARHYDNPARAVTVRCSPLTQCADADVSQIGSAIQTVLHYNALRCVSYVRIEGDSVREALDAGSRGGSVCTPHSHRAALGGGE